MNDLDEYMYELYKSKITRKTPEELRADLLKGLTTNQLKNWRSGDWYIPPNHFEKWQACGNDFIIMSEPAYDIPVAQICDRNFGIGADGLIFILPSNNADVKMRIINSDGTEAEMCGNGIRCLGQFMAQRTGCKALTVETLAGIKDITIRGVDVKVNMGNPIGYWNDFLELPGRSYNAFHVDMGNPHCVLLVNGVEEGDVEKYGKMLEDMFDVFPDRANIEFVEIKGRKKIRVMVWERGAGRTLGCGTGACASAAVAYDCGLTDAVVTVQLDGGDVEVDSSGIVTYDGVILNGMAEYAFKGEIDPPKEVPVPID